MMLQWFLEIIGFYLGLLKINLNLAIYKQKEKTSIVIKFWFAGSWIFAVSAKISTLKKGRGAL